MHTSPIAQEELQRIKETIQASKNAHPSNKVHPSCRPNNTGVWEKEIENLLLLLDSTIHQYQVLADNYILDPFSPDFEAVQLHTRTIKRTLQLTRKRLEKYRALYKSKSIDNH